MRRKTHEPLSLLRKRIPKGDWTYSNFFLAVDVIKNWTGPLPSKLGICKPEDDLNVMIAYVSTVSSMNAFEEMEREDKRKKRGRGRAHRNV